MAMRALFTAREEEAFCFYFLFFHPAALLRSSNVEALLSHPCYYYLSIPFHARHWLWIRLILLGLKAAVILGQTITPTTDEANLFIRLHNHYHSPVPYLLNVINVQRVTCVANATGEEKWFNASTRHLGQRQQTRESINLGSTLRTSRRMRTR